ncbi:hypothetical protein C8R45DRAFT_54573 [Mycena sanguinolenta]|nr:hypothetical protein C8R45DRAFT_54573 [Mycena sanguinolenta]
MNFKNSVLSAEVEEILFQGDGVDARQLAQAGIILKDNMYFIGIALQTICTALRRSEIEPGAPVTILLHETAVELDRLAICVQHLIESLYDLYTASHFPSLSTSIATETLCNVDSHLALVQNSSRAVHSICASNALPRAVYSLHNPIPALCRAIHWIPPSVALWRELVGFADVLVAIDGVLPAARTLRNFLKQALDAPACFNHNRELMTMFWHEFMVPLNAGYRHLQVNAHNLQFHCTPRSTQTHSRSHVRWGH